MTAPLPLDGIRVVDLSRVLAGPFATMVLADLGADVIKVEPPEGDETRGWGPPWWGEPEDRRSAYFAAVNRNKRSVVLDLRADAGRAALEDLLVEADLLVHNYRPATAARLGVAVEAVSARHPDLVVAAIGGFAGADADRPAYDLLAQAVSGLMSVTGTRDGGPTKVGVALLDLLAGLECAVGALAALVGRGRVRSVEVGLVETGVTTLVNVLANHLATGEEPARYGNAHPNIVPYESFEAADGPIVVAVGNDRQFAGLLEALGLTDGDGRYRSNARRVARREELTTWLAGAIRERDRASLLQALAERDVPSGPVNTVGEAVAALEAAEGGPWTVTIDGIRLPPSAIRADGGRLPVRRPPPRLGEHTAEVLEEVSRDR